MMNALRRAYAAASLRFPALMEWLRQTSTIIGIMGIVGTVTAALSGEMTWGLAVPALVTSLVGLLMPGHPEVQGSAHDIAVQAVLLADKSRRAQAMNQMVQDALDLTRRSAATPPYPPTAG